ncbi:hypothetical protein HDU93_007045 [Gonapodya sp. JEL0774]|nr:hypothetical protein HDU93_007045 [Gonapodya sp. JEL0774]
MSVEPSFLTDCLHLAPRLEPYLQPGMRVLDVGSGSGYLSACMAEMVGPTGLVVAVEHIPELANLTLKNIHSHQPEWLRDGRIEVHTADGRLGFSAKAPYDAIHVGAAAPTIPCALIEQLKSPGRMVIPVGTTQQDLYRVEKSVSGEVKEEELMGVFAMPSSTSDGGGTSVTTISTTGKRRRPKAFIQEMQTASQLAVLVKELSVNARKARDLKSQQDLNSMKSLTTAIKDEEELSILKMEALVGIINPTARRQLVRNRLLDRMTDEKELANAIQVQKDEFLQFVWKRRVEARGETRQLFHGSTSAATVAQKRLGDMLAQASLETLRSFEVSNRATLCKYGIDSGLIEQDDIDSFFLPKTSSDQVRLCSTDPRAVLSPSRLSFRLMDTNSGAFDSSDRSWVTVTATTGLNIVRLLQRPMLRRLVLRAIEQVALGDAPPRRASMIRYEGMSTSMGGTQSSTSFVHVLAHVLDAVHPSHELPASVLAFPLYAPIILRRRLSALGYDLRSAPEDGSFDARSALDILNQVDARLGRSMRFYFELTTGTDTEWMVSFVPSKATSFASQGSAFTLTCDGVGLTAAWDASVIPLNISVPADLLRTSWGFLLDAFDGSIAVLGDRGSFTLVFGEGSLYFPPSIQEEQREIITSNELIPNLSLRQSAVPSVDSSNKPGMQVNFGESVFAFDVGGQAQPFNKIVEYVIPKSYLGSDLGEKQIRVSGEATAEEEEEKLQMVVIASQPSGLLLEAHNILRLPTKHLQAVTLCYCDPEGLETTQRSPIETTLEATAIRRRNIDTAPLQEVSEETAAPEGAGMQNYPKELAQKALYLGCAAESVCRQIIVVSQI